LARQPDDDEPISGSLTHMMRKLAEENGSAPGPYVQVVGQQPLAQHGLAQQSLGNYGWNQLPETAAQKAIRLHTEITQMEQRLLTLRHDAAQAAQEALVEAIQMVDTLKQLMSAEAKPDES
jgi:hypothetical protein